MLTKLNKDPDMDSWLKNSQRTTILVHTEMVTYACENKSFWIRNASLYMEFITVPFWVEWEMKCDPQFTQIFHREQRANHVLPRLIVDQHLTNRNTGIIVRTYQFCPVLSKVSTWPIRIQELLSGPINSAQSCRISAANQYEDRNY